MNHPTDELIITYLYKKANSDEVAEMESHIAGCGECAQKIDGIRKTVFDVDRIDDNAAPEFLENKLAAFFERINAMPEPDAQDCKVHTVPSDNIMTPVELSAFLKLPLKSVYDLLDEIPHLVLDGQIRFRRTSVDDWLESKEKNVASKKLD